jgi:hypothetical protein
MIWLLRKKKVQCCTDLVPVSWSYDCLGKKGGERQGATHHGGAGDVGASDDSLDSQEAPRKLHDNIGVPVEKCTDTL